MTIKIKLIANALVVAAIVTALSLASFFSMSFVREKMTYLTETSTPLQIGTIELQRELQDSASALLELNVARNMAEYSRFRAETEKKLAKVTATQHALKKQQSNSTDLSTELSALAQELFTAVEVRIKSSDAATAANQKMTQRMQISTLRLKELDTSIRKLQASRSDAFTQALDSTARFSARLRSIEILRDYFKDLQHLTKNLQKLEKGTSLLIVRGKLNTLAAQIVENEHFKANQVLASQYTGVMDNLLKQLKLLAAIPSGKESEGKESILENLKEQAAKISTFLLMLDQDMIFAGDRLAAETTRQQEIFNQSGTANSILVANLELVTLGLRVTGETNRLFTVESAAELEKLDGEIRSLFSNIQELFQVIEKLLSGLQAREELQMLRSAASTLTSVRTEIYASDGILTTLKKKLQAIRQADESAVKLRSIVVEQAAKGTESVLAARTEQSKAVGAVHTTISKSLTKIFAFSAVTIVIGILFGLWIYRSILLPLRVVLGAVRSQEAQGQEKAHLAEAVASGDLNQEVIVSQALQLNAKQLQKDEMGMVLQAVVGMSKAQTKLDRALADMTESLRSGRDEEVRRDRLKSGLHELNKIMRGEHDIQELVEYSLAFMAAFLDAGVGIIYLYNDAKKRLLPAATYAVSLAERPEKGVLKPGEGLVGQVAIERKTIHLETVPPGYLPIASALGEADPLQIAILPIMHNNLLAGVLELGSFKRFGTDDFEFLDQALEGMAIAINANHSHQLVSDLLEQTQSQSEELRAQQEQLQQTNEELEERARMFEERIKTI